MLWIILSPKRFREGPGAGCAAINLGDVCFHATQQTAIVILL